LGEEHPATLGAIGNLAISKDMLGESESALLMFDRVWKAYQEIFGAEHPATQDAKNNVEICRKILTVASRKQCHQPTIKEQAT